MRKTCSSLILAAAALPGAALAVEFDDDRFLDTAPPAVSLMRSGNVAPPDDSFAIAGSYTRKESGTRVSGVPFSFSHKFDPLWSMSILGDARSKIEPAQGDSLSGFGNTVAKVSRAMTFNDRFQGGASAGFKFPTSKPGIDSQHTDTNLAANLKMYTVPSDHNSDALSVSTVATRVGGQKPEGASQFSYSGSFTYATGWGPYGLSGDFTRRGRSGVGWRSEASLIGKRKLANNMTVNLTYTRGLTEGSKSNLGKLGVEIPF